MIFPCKNCIVDAVCIKACDDFKNYLKLKKTLDVGYTITSARLKRFSELSILKNLIYFHYYVIAYKRFMEDKKWQG